MKDFKIKVPNGYEIDKEKSTFERIIFKKIKNKLPQSWEEMDEFLSMSNYIKEIVALKQLLQLRDRYNGDWKANWNGSSFKSTIAVYQNEVKVQSNLYESHPLVFKTKELAEQFFAAPKIRELLEIAKPLL